MYGVTIMSEGYSGISKIFPFGDSLYLFETVEERQRFIDAFYKWKNALGPCEDATPTCPHLAGEHVCIKRVFEIECIKADNMITKMFPISEKENL